MDQHYLPRCYMNEFANPSGNLFSLNNELFRYGKRGYIQSKSPAQICYVPDYYTLDMQIPPTYQHLNQEDPLVIERELFWKYENQYPATLDRIKNRISLSYTEAEVFIKGLISMKLRNKYIRDGYSGEQHQQMLQKIFNDDLVRTVYDARKHYPNASDQEILDTIETVRVRATEDPEFIKMIHLTGLIDRERNPDSVINAAAAKLLKAKWILHESDLSATFITTDNPGYCVDSQDRVNNIKLADCTLFFPLTPLLCLMISDRVNDDELPGNLLSKRLHYRPVNASFINQVNQRSLHYFSRYVLAQTRQTLNAIAAMITLRNQQFPG